MHTVQQLDGAVALRDHVERLRALERSGSVWITVGTIGVDGVDALLTPDSPPFVTGTHSDPPRKVTRFRRLPVGYEIQLHVRGVAPGDVVFRLPVGFFDPTFDPVEAGATDDGTFQPWHVDGLTGDVIVDTGVGGPAGPPGPAGAPGASSAWHDGSGAPSAGLGSDGDYYLDDATGNVYLKTSGTWSIVANIKGATGATGAAGGTGAAGAAGASAGLKFTYSTDTANTDPGTGKLKFDTVTLSAITSLRISETDADGNSLATVVQSWDDSSSTVRATVTMVKDGAPSNILVFQITGTVTDNGTWDSVAVTYVASSGAFANGDTVRVLVSRTGDKGDTGASGATGPAGSVSIVSSLPGSPANGDECYLKVGTGDTAVLWHLKYDSAITDAFKWRFLGGGPRHETINTGEATSSAAFGDLATVGPSVTIPYAGIYEVKLSAYLQQAAGNGVAVASPSYNGSTPTDDDGVALQVAGTVQGVSGNTLQITVSSIGTSAVVKMQYRVTSGTATFFRRNLELRPVRIG